MEPTRVAGDSRAARRHGDVLFAVRGKAHGIAADRRAERGIEQHLARRLVVGPEVTGDIAAEDETAAHRWHRWGDVLGAPVVPPAFAHTGARAPFAFPDGTTIDWVLTPDGWRARPIGAR